MKKYILFGTGQRAARIISALTNLHIEYAVDNDRAKWGRDVVLNGRPCPVLPVDRIGAETLENCDMIIGSLSTAEMIGQIRELTKNGPHQIMVRSVEIADSRGSFRIYFLSFGHCDALTHTFFTKTNSLVFYIGDQPCSVRIQAIAVNGKPYGDRRLLGTNGDREDGDIIHFPCMNPTIYIDEPAGMESICIRLAYLETNYQKAHAFAYAYIRTLSDFSNNRNPHFVPEAEVGSIVFQKEDVRPIAYYLPQFHQTIQNDQWWEKGFTEWTNVTKTYPLFEGHYQPHLPIDTGFYDLSYGKAQLRQMELAKKYGVYGFCYYYYHYQTMKLLDTPINLHLSNPAMDFPFCIFWANESWSRAWTGNDKQKLVLVGDTDEYYLDVIRDMLPFLRDPRYIQVEGKPLIIVYLLAPLKDPLRFTRLWRSYCHRNGLGDIVLLYVKDGLHQDPAALGFDGMVEFSPFSLGLKDNAYRHRLYESGFSGEIYEYAEALRVLDFQKASYLLYKNVFPCWDNTPRYHSRARIFHGATPELYKQWLKQTIAYTRQKIDTADKYVFINAWNEWAEGAHLEPDRQYGYAYLQATREALLETRQEP